MRHASTRIHRFHFAGIGWFFDNTLKQLAQNTNATYVFALTRPFEKMR